MALAILTFTAVPTAQRYVTIAVTTTDADFLTVRRRRQDGTWAIVRGAQDYAMGGGGWVGYDYEAPQGRVLTYEAIVSDGVDEVKAQVDLDPPLDYGGDWLMPVGRWEFGMNLFVEFDGISSMDHAMIQDTVPILGRLAPVSVSWGRLLRRGSITFLTMDDLERRSFLKIIEYPIMMFAARHGYGYDDPAFLALSNVTEERTSGLGWETSRRWVVDVQEIERPPATYTPLAPTVSWQDLLDSTLAWTDTVSGSWYDLAGYP